MSKWTAQSDKSAEIAQSQLWAMLEVLGGFLVACLPVMPKFLKATWHAVSGSAIGAAFASAFTTRFSSFSGEKGGQSEKKGAQEARGSDEVVLTIGRRRERHIGVDAQFRDLLESRDSAELGLGLGGAADRSKESKESSISLTRPAPCQLRDDV